MELICPSCEARYRLPDGMIAESGRLVSCTNCGHRWRIFPADAGSAAAEAGPGGPAGAESAGAAPDRLPEEAARPVDTAPGEGGPERLSEGAERPAGAEPGEHAGGHAPGSPSLRRTDPARNAQFAEIRAMLDEVQEPGSPPPAEAGPGGAPAAPTAATDGGRTGRPVLAEVPAAEPPPTGEAESATRRDLPMIDDFAEEQRPTPAPTAGQRMALQRARSEKDEDEIARLRRMQGSADRHHRRRRESGSGAFLTGFLLVVIIGAVMAALYLLAPQIVARFPGTEPMMTDYVETIDDLRGRAAEGYDTARTSVLEMMGREPEVDAEAAPEVETGAAPEVEPEATPAAEPEPEAAPEVDAEPEVEPEPEPATAD